MAKSSQRLIAVYDTTLRDGTQAEGIAISADDKVRVAKKLDELGVHYIEGGWPGSNPNSIEFFKRIAKVKLSFTKIAAFGSTRYVKNTCEKDPNIQALIDVKTPVVTIFGKSWDLHVRDALRIALEQNLDMIADSVSYLKKKGREVVYDAEHFFDAYKRNKEYALATIEAARSAGADCICLCETNGGAIPSEVSAIVREVRSLLPGVALGIHTHNDSACGVANTLAAVEEGAVHVQGTINGYGERCGNANLVSIIANLELKMNCNSIGSKKLMKLAEVSRYVAELANQMPDERAPYVGRSAFAHKGGIHVSAVVRNPETYEHVAPERVGNSRRVLLSDQSGKSNLKVKIDELKLKVDPDAPELAGVLKRIKELENKGYEFEAAEASFVLLVRRALGQLPNFFEGTTWRILDEFLDGSNFVQAMVKMNVNGNDVHTAAEGDGPFNALDLAVRRALQPFYPELSRMKLADYKVRVLNSLESTADAVRVLIISTDGKNTWGTVGVSTNILEASWFALRDSIEYFLASTRGLKKTKKAAREESKN